MWADLRQSVWSAVKAIRQGQWLQHVGSAVKAIRQDQWLQHVGTTSRHRRRNSGPTLMARHWLLYLPPTDSNTTHSMRFGVALN
jgi:hypothetical protein